MLTMVLDALESDMHMNSRFYEFAGHDAVGSKGEENQSVDAQPWQCC